MGENITINGILLGQDVSFQNSLTYFTLLITSEAGWIQLGPETYSYKINQAQHHCGTDLVIQFWELINGTYRMSFGFPQEAGVQINYEAKTGDITLISNVRLNGKIVVVGNKINN